MLPFVYVVGVVNSRGVVHGRDRGFDLSPSELKILANTKRHSMALMVEHHYDVAAVDGMCAVGNIAAFWMAEDEKLWAVAMVNPHSRFGPRTIRRLLMGEFTGFSPGTPFDVDLFAKTNSVDLMGVCEISLVKVPDDPSALIVSMTGAEALSDWPRVERAMRFTYAKRGEVPEDETLDFFLDHKELWSAVTAAAHPSMGGHLE